jgi:hypothetical protein
MRPLKKLISASQRSETRIRTPSKNKHIHEHIAKYLQPTEPRNTWALSF